MSIILDNKAKIKIGLGVFIIGLTALTLNYLLKNIRKLVFLKFDYKSVDLVKVNLKEISFTLNWICKNTSDFNFTLKNQVYDVFINNRFVRKVGSSEETEVYGRGTSIVKTNVYITTTELLKFTTENLSSLVTEEGRKKTKIKVIGTFDISTPLFTLKKLPFYFEDTIHNIMNY
jgi:LEA14-like dessication related protein